MSIPIGNSYLEEGDVERPQKLYRCAYCGTIHPIVEMADVRIVEYDSKRTKIERKPSEHKVFSMRICKECVHIAQELVSGKAEHPLHG